jgi:hypothetical protein
MIGINTSQTTGSETLLQVYAHWIGRRSQSISQDRTTVLVHRLPPPPLMPCGANDAPPLVPLRRVAWLDDDVHVWWHAVPYDRLMPVWQRWGLFGTSPAQASDSLSTHVP